MIDVITIDGPSGSGKGTICRRIARALDFHLLDSGALYRLVGLSAKASGKLDAGDEELAEIARELAARFDWDDRGQEQIWLEGRDVTAEVRTEACGELASQVAAVPAVREALLDLQHSYRAPPGLIADGRDMGTRIFPQAGLKVFLTASAEERAQRRHKQLNDKGIGVSLSAIFQEIAARDQRDVNRAVAPLIAADDAVVIDSTDMSIDAVVTEILRLADERLDISFGNSD